MASTSVNAQRHVQTQAPYNANTFAEQNKALVGLSRRLRGFGFVSITPGTDITLAPGYFMSAGLAINPSTPNRTAGIIAETTTNSTILINDVNADFYIFALVNDTVEGAAVTFVTSNSPTPPSTQHAPIARYIAGQYILEPGLGGDTLEDQVQEARVDAGAEQFFLTPNVGPVPRTVSISSGNLPDGTLFPADAAFPAGGLTASATNYIFYNTGVGVLQFNTTGFPAANMLPLWEVTLDASSNVTSKVDRRPFIGGGSGGGSADDILVRLRDGLDDSVMQNYRLSNLPAEAAPDIDTGTSTGAFLAPSEYELDNGEILESAFTTSASEAPTSIEQVTVWVLVDNVLLNPGDLTIEVSRDGGTTYETVADNHVNHVFAASPAGNNLQLRVTNASGGTVVVRGYAMYYNNIGGHTGVLEARSGIALDGSGLNIYNTNPAAYRAHSPDFSFVWNSGASNGTLSWAGTSPLTVEVSDPLLGTQTNTLASGGSLTGVNASFGGDYVYFDFDRTAVSAITLQQSVGPPVMLKDRFILGRRVGTDFFLFGNHLLPDSATFSQATAQAYPARLLKANQWDALTQMGAGGAAPSVSNPVVTRGDLPAATVVVKNYTASTAATWSFAGYNIATLLVPAGTVLVEIHSLVNETGGVSTGGGMGYCVIQIGYNAYYYHCLRHGHSYDANEAGSGVASSGTPIFNRSTLGASYLYFTYTGSYVYVYGTTSQAARAQVSMIAI